MGGQGLVRDGSWCPMWDPGGRPRGAKGSDRFLQRKRGAFRIGCLRQELGESRRGESKNLREGTNHQSGVGAALVTRKNARSAAPTGEAVSTVDGLTLCGSEGHLRVLTAAIAHSREQLLLG